MNAWSPNFQPPAPPRSDRLLLEPLGEHVVELDYAAIMGSRVRLRTELGWENDWPADDFTVEKNHQDLARHRAEFERREAYAYTVLSPSHGACVGCVYLQPADSQARLAFWVVDSEIQTGLESHLVGTVLDWIETDWAFTNVLVSLKPENPRGIAIAKSLGLREVEQGGLADHVNLMWHRPSSKPGSRSST